MIEKKEIPSEKYMEAEENLIRLFFKTLQTIWELRFKLCKVACIGALIGLLIAFSLPKEYEVSVALAPESKTQSDGGIMSMAASFLGSSLPHSNSDALNVLLAPQILNSTPFLLEILNMNIENECAAIDTNISTYLDHQSKPWWMYVVSFPTEIISSIKSMFSDSKNDNQVLRNGSLLLLSDKEMGKINSLRKRISAQIDKKTSIITVNVGFQDPIVTAVVADSVISKLQKYLTKYKVAKSREDCKYWEDLYREKKREYYQAQQIYAEYLDQNSNIISHSSLVDKERLQNDMSVAYQLYSQVVQQYQMAQAKVQEAKTSFTILEPAVVPLSPSNMGKLKMMAIFAFLLVLCVATWEIFGRHLFKNFKNKLTAYSC